VASSPTARSKQLLEREGFKVGIVEKWNPVVKRRVDLFGVIDLIAVRPGRILMVQTTSSSNMASRVTKIREADDGALLPLLLASGAAVEVHGWIKRRKTRRWECRREELSGGV
jgi:hypothetical protein